MREIVELPKPTLFMNDYDIQSSSIFERGRKIISGEIDLNKMQQGEYVIDNNADEKELVFQINGKLHRMGVDENSKVKLYEVPA